MILPGNSAKFPNIFGTLSVDLEYILLRKLSVIKFGTTLEIPFTLHDVSKAQFILSRL